MQNDELPKIKKVYEPSKEICQGLIAKRRKLSCRHVKGGDVYSLNRSSVQFRRVLRPSLWISVIALPN